MDQSECNKVKTEQELFRQKMKRQKISMDFFVGLFTIIGLFCAAYLSVGLGGLELSSAGKYQIITEFDNISGLKKGATVEIAGVQIGKVRDIELKDPDARVFLDIDKSVKIYTDDIASIRTKGIIGDRYVKISRGASMEPIPSGGKLVETESVVDIEDIIGKLVHSLGSDKSEKTEEK